MNHQFKQTFDYKLIYIFAIDDEIHRGLLKVGETTITSAASPSIFTDNCDLLNASACERIDRCTKTAGIIYELLYTTLAIDRKGNIFGDRAVHEVLKRSGIAQPKEALNGATEWFASDLATIKHAIAATKDGRSSLTSQEISFDRTPIVFRPEQKEAIELTIKQFFRKKNQRAQMLWNAKMRFGKTLSGLEVVKRLKFKRTLIITHRPVVKQSWFEDFDKIFFDSPDYVYGSKILGENLSELNQRSANFVYFASIQDLRGSAFVGGKFEKNHELFTSLWDFVIIDEAHEGTQTKLGNEIIQHLCSCTPTTKSLFLSGTPFNLLSYLSKQTFKENEIYTWDYVMEQRAKEKWIEGHFADSNPYENLPRMNIFTYDLSDILTNNRFEDIEDAAFNFKEFFRTWTGNVEADHALMPIESQVGDFIYKSEVMAFLNLLAKEGNHNYPFSSSQYRDNFRHTLWIVPGVKSAKALSALLKEHPVFQHFTIVNVAGDGDEEARSDDALRSVTKAIGNDPGDTWTITISCGRLTTGVSVPAWSAVLMLSGSSSTSASSYMQTIFRVQTPATIKGRMKTNCFVFDFAPDRTLKVIAEACELSTRGTSDNTARTGDFLNFCPVIGFSGSQMIHYNAKNILVQLKKVMIDRVVRNGFDDRNLYNDNLLRLTELELLQFEKLKTEMSARNPKGSGDIVINDQGLDDEIRDSLTDIMANKKQLDAAQIERKKKLRERANAIAVLREISIRIPLLIYGTEIDIEQKVSIETFPKLVDDNSWDEFMPKGVTKQLFRKFSKYFDNEVFIEAGLRIRKMAKSADDLEPIERVQAISNLFALFKNPDKETILTSWQVVNMHLGTTIGGVNFFNEDYTEQITINDTSGITWINKEGFTDEIFNKNSAILDINSKTGLYPLYAAISIYQNARQKGLPGNNLYKDVVENNVYAICRTRMAAAITKRTLKGFKSDTKIKPNVLVIDDIVEQMKKQSPTRYSTLVRYITNPKTWKKGAKTMNFTVIGNPPYQNEVKQQIYTDFYLLAKSFANVLSLIFPVGWQKPKTANNLAKMNTREVKRDRQIVFIDNRRNLFPGVTGAEWTNLLLWKRDYNNQLDGKQLLYNNGEEEEVLLPLSKSDIEKPSELTELVQLVRAQAFHTMKTSVSSLKPYGLRTDFFDNPEKYHLPPLQTQRINDDDIRIFGLCERRQVQMYAPSSYPIPKFTPSYLKYKVFVAKAWGNWSKNHLGGSYSDIIVAQPNDICTENFLEVGGFDTYEEANNLAKYLMTRFARALLYVNKFSQDNSKEKFLDIPLFDFSAPIFNGTIEDIENNLFVYYHVPSHIINFVTRKIQKRDESNIVFLR